MHLRLLDVPVLVPCPNQSSEIAKLIYDRNRYQPSNTIVSKLWPDFLNLAVHAIVRLDYLLTITGSHLNWNIYYVNWNVAKMSYKQFLCILKA